MKYSDEIIHANIIYNLKQNNDIEKMKEVFVKIKLKISQNCL